MTQPTLEDALAARDEAVERVERNAQQDWMTFAYATVKYLASLGGEFTTDDVWARLDAFDVHTHEPRAMGAVMKRATKRGFIEPTGTYVKSTRPKCHARPIPQYRGVRQ